MGEGGTKRRKKKETQISGECRKDKAIPKNTRPLETAEDISGPRSSDEVAESRI
jgi:hypothetical protein